MKNNIAVFIFSAVLLFCLPCCSKKTSISPINPPPPTPVPVPVATTYQLVWSDEFNKDGLPDNTKWGYDVGGNGWGNNELEYYTNRPENTIVENGVLKITAIKK